MNNKYVYLIKGEHADGVGHGGEQGRAGLTGVIAGISDICRIGDARVKGGKAAGDVIAIAIAI
jgi:hypothetical protein